MSPMVQKLLDQAERGDKLRLPSMNPPFLVQLAAIGRNFLDCLLKRDGRVVMGEAGNRAVDDWQKADRIGPVRSTDLMGGTDNLQFEPLRKGADFLRDQFDLTGEKEVIQKGLLAGLTALRCENNLWEKQVRGPLMGVPTSWGWLNVVNLCSSDLALEEVVRKPDRSIAESVMNRVYAIPELHSALVKLGFDSPSELFKGVNKVWIDPREPIRKRARDIVDEDGTEPQAFKKLPAGTGRVVLTDSERFGAHAQPHIKVDKDTGEITFLVKPLKRKEIEQGADQIAFRGKRVEFIPVKEGKGGKEIVRKMV